MSASSSSPDAAARRSCGNRPPTTAAARTTDRARGDSVASRDPRMSRSVDGSSAPVRPLRDELLDVERQAVGALEERVDHGRLGPAAEDPGELLAHLVATEGGELDPLDGFRSIQLGEERSQRVSPVQVVAAIGRDDRAAAPTACCGR